MTGGKEMVVFDLEMNVDGRLYIPSSLRKKMSPDMAAISIEGVVLIVRRDMNRDMVLECVKAMLEELSLEQRIRKIGAPKTETIQAPLPPTDVNPRN
jgi:TRAP-type uncharacterized transport system substrate-binding protein